MKFLSSSFLIITSLQIFINSDTSFSQDTVKIMSYNLLNYSGSVLKDNSFRKVINFEKPDILVVEEIISQNAVYNMVSNVMNYYSAGLYSAGTFINGPDTDNAVFFKSSKFIFLYNQAISTSLRTINLFVLKHISSGDTIRLFAVHLKAGSTNSDTAQRHSEVKILRSVTNAYSPGTEFAVLGDFNIYRSTEPAYQKLIQIQAGNEGHFTDPLTMNGLWNQSTFAQYHTQSTRTRNLNDSGATGGLDDRFDMILNSKGLTEDGKIKFIPGSLKAVGNDGYHYNDSINKRPNTSVPDSIADALYFGSDHLPVISLYKFDNYYNTLNLSVIPEGLYNEITNKLSRKDTFKIYLRSTISPYLKIDSAKSVLDSITFSGQFIFKNTPPGNYFITTDHFNTVETWSRSGGENMFMGSSFYNYDFTTSELKAYGNNLKLKGSEYCVFSGDVYKDGIIDAADLSAVENDASISISEYVAADLNGDNFVDATDISIVANNVSIGVIAITP